MDLKREPHYKLYVRLRESIIFDAALNEAQIDCLREENPINEYVRYYFKVADSTKVDQINKDLQLSLSTETIPSLDYEITKKEWIIYILVGLIMGIIILITALF
ncbi:MAG: hypothetical protein WBA61_15655 [Aequorivita sp.]